MERFISASARLWAEPCSGFLEETFFWWTPRLEDSRRLAGLPLGFGAGIRCSALLLTCVCAGSFALLGLESVGRRLGLKKLNSAPLRREADGCSFLSP